MHARKMTALLQWATASDDRPILLHYRANAGHMPGALDTTIDDDADQLRFCFANWT
jgi:prolyl oligopeptidase